MKSLPTAKIGLLSASLLAGSVFSTAVAEEAPDPPSFKAAIAASKPIFNFRLRYEGVSQDGVPEDASALTYRFRAGVETGSFLDTKFLIEFDHIGDLIDDYNSLTNGKGSYAVVADPEATELNRIQLTNTSLPDTKITLGRQRIILDDSRFIGNVGWRQNEQTFDGLRVTNTSIGELKVDVSYVTAVNRILGPESAAGRWTGDSYLVNVSHPTPIGKVTGFGYFIDADEAGANSNQTLGVRLAGSQKTGPGKLSYTLSAAQQQDFGSNNSDYQASYYLVDVGYAYEKMKFGVGYEVLGSDDGLSFRTPFATVHKFQGWADKFLTTPANGVQDMYVSAGFVPGNLGPLEKVSFTAIYHDLSAESGSSDYGSEIDLVAKAKWNVLGFTLKYADYSADDYATDTQKLWFQIDYSF